MEHEDAGKRMSPEDCARLLSEVGEDACSEALFAVARMLPESEGMLTLLAVSPPESLGRTRDLIPLERWGFDTSHMNSRHWIVLGDFLLFELRGRSEITGLVNSRGCVVGVSGDGYPVRRSVDGVDQARGLPLWVSVLALVAALAFLAWVASQRL